MRRPKNGVSIERRQPDTPVLCTKHHRDEHLLLIEVKHGEMGLKMELIDSIE